MVLHSNTAAMVEAGMAKPIHTSRQGIVTSSKEVATIKTPAIHTPNKQATPILHNLLRHNHPMEGDSNREATRVDMVKLRQRMVPALPILAVRVRPPAATVRPMLKAILE